MTDPIESLGLVLDKEGSKLKIISHEMETKCLQLANNIDDTISSEYFLLCVLQAVTLEIDH